MDFAPEDELKILRSSIRAFAADAVAPRVRIMEETGEMPPEFCGLLAGQGLFGISVPFDCGGTQMTSLERLVMLEEVARVSAATAAWLAVQHTAAAALLETGGPREKKEVLPELAAGRQFAALALVPPPGTPGPPITFRTVLGDSYRLDGQASWCYGAPAAEWFLVEGIAPGQDAALFLLSRSAEGLVTGPATPATGLRGCPAGPVQLAAAYVPPEARLGRRPARAVGDVIAAAHALGFCGIVLGVMQAAMEAGLDFATKRVLYGKPIAGLQSVQFRLAEMYADLEAGRLLAYRTAWLMDRDAACALDMVAAYQFLAGSALRGTRKAVEIFGGYGCLQDFPVERFYRDALTLTSRECPIRLDAFPDGG